MKQDMILILDLGSEENSRLARAVRALGVYSEIRAHDITEQELAAIPNLKGIILNGGRNNVVDGVPVLAGEHVKSSGLPILSSAHAAQKWGMIWQTLPENDCALEEELKPFVFVECAASANWSSENFISDQTEAIRRQVGDGKVLLALSGGVDSSVVAALLQRAVVDRLHCVHVNHGLMRKGESEQVLEVFRERLGANLVYVDAADRFLKKLEGISDPEEKRKIIGAEFIRVFEEEARKLDGIDYLAQGTIYPDIVESGTKTAPNIKSHHNVGGLPKDLRFELVEPIRFLFKDEVRAVGTALELPADMIYRQPFPGPGLGVRCLGAITKNRLETLREADAVLRDEFAKSGLSESVWQYFAVVPDFKSTGMRDGKRSFDWPVIIRAVNTVDAMTATAPELPFSLLSKITARILSEVAGTSRVLYDLSPKPPATIEWE